MSADEMAATKVERKADGKAVKKVALMVDVLVHMKAATTVA